MTTEKTRPALLFQSRVRAAPTVVFDAFFREPQRWLCREASINLKMGGALRMCWPDGCFEGQFVQCEPPTLARFSWRMQGDSLPETMPRCQSEATLARPCAVTGGSGSRRVWPNEPRD